MYRQQGDFLHDFLGVTEQINTLRENMAKEEKEREKEMRRVNKVFDQIMKSTKKDKYVPIANMLAVPFGKAMSFGENTLVETARKRWGEFWEQRQKSPELTRTACERLKTAFHDACISGQENFARISGNILASFEKMAIAGATQAMPSKTLGKAEKQAERGHEEQAEDLSRLYQG